MKDVKIKHEKTEAEDPDPYEDDDDVMILPNEVPIVTEIIDDEEQLKAEPATESAISDVEEPELNNITIDDDVMIQEPKIVTENLIESDDDEEIGDSNHISHLPLILKIKEEPKDDDEDNDEDNFMDVATIDNDFMNGK